MNKNKFIIIVLLSIFLAGFLFYTPAKPVHAISDQCYWNPFYNLKHPEECGGIDTTNPYCQNPDDCGVQAGMEQVGEKVQGIATTTSATELILGWLQFFLGFVFLLAVVALVAAGVMFVASFGNDSLKQKATKIIIWAIVGLVLIMLSYAIVTLIVRSLH